MNRNLMKWPLYVSLGGIFGGILGLISMWAWLSASVILFLPATTWWPKWVDIVAYNLPYAGIAVGTIGGSYLLLNYDKKGKAIGSFLIFWRNSLHLALLFRFILYLSIYYGSVTFCRIFPRLLNNANENLYIFFFFLPGFYILPSFIIYLPLLYWECHSSAAAYADFRVLRARSTIFSFLVGANWPLVLIWFNNKPDSFELLDLICIVIPLMVLVSVPWTVFGWKAAGKYWGFNHEKRLQAATVKALARFALLYWLIFAAIVAAAGGILFFRWKMLPLLSHSLQDVLL